ncbi:hypothetical protein U471_08560 [Bacillus sp. CN2]|nr:hypothetical protein U471_08560 [Bacillus sp. CN2]
MIDFGGKNVTKMPAAAIRRPPIAIIISVTLLFIFYERKGERFQKKSRLIRLPESLFSI